MPLSKNKIKFIQSLKDKKNRQEHGVFVAEGLKLVTDLLPHLRCKLVAALPRILPPENTVNAEEVVEASEEEMKKATFLKTPPQIIAVFYQPHTELSDIHFGGKLTLVSDGIQDPGNLGTIVRLADWFGIENVVCSPDTADIYSPKTVQATMGAIARVQVHYTDVAAFLSKHRELPVYGTFLEGENIYRTALSNHGFIVMGSEGHGIRPETEKQITQKLFIPSFPPQRTTSESLNVAVATAIVCAEFRRRQN